MGRTNHEQVVYAWRKCELRVLCVEYICWWWAQTTCSQRTYIARDMWDLLMSFVQFKGRLEWSTSAVYVFRSGVCCSCLTATVRNYGSVCYKIVRCTCVSSKIYIQTHPYTTSGSTYDNLWIRLVQNSGL